MLAVPGDLASPTGGYAYARRVLAEAGPAGWPLRHLALPDGFPRPSPAALEETGRRLAAVPAGEALIVDGLALGALPPALLKRVRAPLVALCHHPLARETGLTPEASAALARSERAALALASAVVCASAATAAELRADYGIAAPLVAPPGTDPRPPAAGSGEAAPVILSVGALIPRKGFGTLLAALARLRDLPWRAEIAGAADRDPAEAARLAALARSEGLEGRVRFLGALGAEALDARYARADLFALPSLHEGFGMVFAESVAHGLPVLGPDLPAVREATAGGATLLPPGAEAWADALRRLLSDPAARAAGAARAREAASRLPRWPGTLAVLRRACEAALARRP